MDWHVDSGSSESGIVRKLSISVQLSLPTDYEGGELEFAGHEQNAFSRIAGTVTCFPSYCVHRVTPILSGERCSLVCFALGPAFR